ncbi:MAG: DNA recombination protein RmuC, partial [Alphaproteobacteria bacterium]
MDASLLIAVVIGVAGLLALGAAVLVLMRRSDGGQQQVAALGERLAQMTETQAAQQAQLAQTLQAQERTLAKSVDERLQQLTGKIDATLQKTDKNQKTALDELKERLVRIDTAQK